MRKVLVDFHRVIVTRSDSHGFPRLDVPQGVLGLFQTGAWVLPLIADFTWRTRVVPTCRPGPGFPIAPQWPSYTFLSSNRRIYFAHSERSAGLASTFFHCPKHEYDLAVADLRNQM